MINLIPIEEKKNIQKDFYCRVAIVILFMFCCLIFISTIAILPAYFVSYEKKVSIGKKLELQKNEVMPEIDQRAQTIIKDLDARLSLLEKARKNKYVFSEKVISEIISQKMPEIKIDRIAYEIDPIDGRRVSINGSAPNREELLSFRRALENDPLFKSVDLPISNFVKGKDIQFSLNLISM